MYANPILRGFNPDPSICRVGDTYYIATSTFEWYPGVQIFASQDLENWELAARPLNRPDLLDMRGAPDSCGVWAPCITHADGLFWLLYTNVRRFDGDFKDTPNYLTTCPSIDGEWSAPVYLNSSGFDPSLFHDDDGRKWVTNMVWDHRSDRTYFGGIMLQEYSVEQARLIGPRTNIFPGSPTGYTEGPHIYKVDGSYYLMTAEGGTGYTHAVTMARADQIEGPYELDPERHVITAAGHPDAPIQRTGHGGLVQTPDGGWRMTSLVSRPLPRQRRSPMGRESGLFAVAFNEEGWLRLAEPETAFEAGPARPSRTTYTFDGPTLHTDFQWLRTPEPDEIFSLSERPGRLRLFGRESPGSLFAQALVARRQTEFCYQAATIVEFEPDDFQQMAGLIVYYNQHKFHYLYVGYDETVGKHLRVLSCPADQSLHAVWPMNVEPVALPADALVHLKVEAAYDALEFFWSLDGSAWTKIGPTLDASQLSDEAGKGEGANFTGTFVGMACHDLTGRAATADFSEFVYEDL